MAYFSGSHMRYTVPVPNDGHHKETRRALIGNGCNQNPLSAKPRLSKFDEKHGSCRQIPNQFCQRHSVQACSPTQVLSGTSDSENRMWKRKTTHPKNSIWSGQPNVLCMSWIGGPTTGQMMSNADGFDGSSKLPNSGKCCFWSAWS